MKKILFLVILTLIISNIYYYIQLNNVIKNKVELNNTIKDKVESNNVIRKKVELNNSIEKNMENIKYS
jgi:cell division protein FtsL